MWASTPYRLTNDEVIKGRAASILRMLDERDPLTHPLNDAEVLDELVLIWPDMKWCPQLGCTISSTGFDTFCEQQGTGLVAEQVLFLNDARRIWARNEMTRAAGVDDAAFKAAKAMLAHAERASNASRVAGVVELFKLTRQIDQAELNTEAAVLGTPHGVLDMDSGHLCVDDGESGEAFMVTLSTNARMDSRYTDMRYDKRWDTFIDEIMCGDAELAAYLQRALGYSMLGGNREECLFVAYGATTRNGKDTLLESVRHALGDYAAVAERNFLCSSRNDGGTDEALASLAGKRFVTVSEPPRGRKLDEAKVKEITACGKISTSRKYGAQFEFTPRFTIWMNVNNLPAVSDDSVFEGDRIRVIPFERHFAPHERDKTLKARFCTPNGAYTVLQWLLDGYRDYTEQGLAEPAKVRDATRLYAGAGGNTVDRFLRKCCRLSPSAKVENSTFQAAYRDYCENILGEDAMSSSKMRESLVPYGVVKRRSHGKDWWLGVELSVVSEAANLLEKVAPKKRPESEKGAKNSATKTRKIPI